MTDDSGKLLAEFPGAAAIAVTAFAAALLGTLFGLSAARRLIVGTRHELDPETADSEDSPQALVSWTRLSRLEAELATSQEALASLQRDYLLDTGLLKQEIQRLELLLGRFSSGKEAASREAGGRLSDSAIADPGYHSLKLVDPLRTKVVPIRFSPLSSLDPSVKPSVESQNA